MAKFGKDIAPEQLRNAAETIGYEWDRVKFPGEVEDADVLKAAKAIADNNEQDVDGQHLAALLYYIADMLEL